MLLRRTFCVLLYLAAVVCSQKCRFAHSYNTHQLASDGEARSRFVAELLRWEAGFHSDGVGVNAQSGLSYDGHRLDVVSGELIGEGHSFTAASKESLHIAILTLAVQGNELAQLWLLPNAPPTSCVETAIDILTSKVTSYEKFDREYPGYGGFLPWVSVNDSGMVPTWDWATRVPSLDNGQLAWTAVAAAHILKEKGYTELALRWEAVWKKMASTSRMVFYERDGKVRTVTNIVDTSAQPTAENYYPVVPCGEPCYLDDPYEGELLVLFMDLYAAWENVKEREDMWVLKRKKLQAAQLETPEGRITVQRGWWFSAHEQWKYMLLPYTSIDINKRVFLNGERARTWYSWLHHIPGMFASVTDIATDNDQPLSYRSACGIQDLAFETVTNFQVVTPYAAFATILANNTVGLTWIHTMLQAPRMQNRFGTTEAANITGTGVSPIVTWDTKATTALALMGGVSSFTEAALKAGKNSDWDRFSRVVEHEWSLVFDGILEGEELGFKFPSSFVPKASADDFTSCE